MHNKHDTDKHVDEIRTIILDLQEIFMEAIRAALAIGSALACGLSIFAFLANP